MQTPVLQPALGHGWRYVAYASPAIAKPLTNKVAMYRRTRIQVPS
jgi:hypothetical protein